MTMAWYLGCIKFTVYFLVQNKAFRHRSIFMFMGAELEGHSDIVKENRKGAPRGLVLFLLKQTINLIHRNVPKHILFSPCLPSLVGFFVVGFCFGLFWFGFGFVFFAGKIG